MEKLRDLIVERQKAYRLLFLKYEDVNLRWYQKLALRLLPSVYRTKKLLDLPWQSRVVLEDIINFCNVNESVFDTDATIMAFQAGKREVAQRILANLYIDIDDVVSTTQPNEESV